MTDELKLKAVHILHAAGWNGWDIARVLSCESWEVSAEITDTRLKELSLDARPIDQLNLSHRLLVILRRNGRKTVADLIPLVLETEYIKIGSIRSRPCRGLRSIGGIGVLGETEILRALGL